ncbi:hypothetical protein GIB67_018097 [Kingdonia uniflora]|uniref:Globin domain-containing protein n=1 Tax=Kingdonia uniflora TaxID=39325 RepID=A0A7J7NWV0_9MAGN|nr:hypothetical protein GIB67_018097 [Kingdonia uniflora]
MSSISFERSWQISLESATELWLDFPSISIFEMAPVAKGMFSYLKDFDEIPQKDPRLKAHTVVLFKMTCEAAVQLREKGEVVVSENTLKNLGSLHVKKGVIDPHFEVVKEALLRTIKETVGERWSEEMGSTWAEAYDQLAATIKPKMKA